jgi:hypothetical protein
MSTTPATGETPVVPETVPIRILFLQDGQQILEADCPIGCSLSHKRFPRVHICRGISHIFKTDKTSRHTRLAGAHQVKQQIFDGPLYIGASVILVDYHLVDSSKILTNGQIDEERKGPIMNTRSPITAHQPATQLLFHPAWNQVDPGHAVAGRNHAIPFPLFHLGA